MIWFFLVIVLSGGGIATFMIQRRILAAVIFTIATVIGAGLATLAIRFTLLEAEKFGFPLFIWMLVCGTIIYLLFPQTDNNEGPPPHSGNDRMFDI